MPCGKTFFTHRRSFQTIHASRYCRNQLPLVQEIANCYATIKIDRVHIPLFHVNAFTEQSFLGNPAAVCFLDSWLDEDRLRKVAAENNLSATAFLVPARAGYEMRWFTPRCEVKLCGHATLASGTSCLTYDSFRLIP